MELVTALADRHTCRELLWVLAGEAKLAQLIRLPNIRGGMGRRREYWDNYLALASGNFALFLITLQGPTLTYDTFLESACQILQFYA